MWRARQYFTNAGYETTTRRQSRRCSRVRWPRFPHLAVRPHTSKHGYETASSQPVVDLGSKFVRRGVRRRHRSQRPTATVDPNTKQPRGGQAAAVAGYADPGLLTWPSRPHPSRHGSESASPQPAPWQKDVRRGVRRRDRGQRPTATEDPNTKPTAQAGRRHCNRLRR